MTSLWSDIKYGVRMLAKRPGFTAIAVITLALGIGANTAIFGVIYNLMFRPLQGTVNPEQLVSITMMDEGNRYPNNMSYANYLDMKELEEVFSDAIAYNSWQAQLSSEGMNPERIFPFVVSGNYFEMLGVQAAQGRTFSVEEQTDPGAGNVLVISHTYWQSRFGGDPATLNQVISLNDNPFTIVGILPETFRGTSVYFAPQVFLPVTGIDYLTPDLFENLETRGKSLWVSVVARLQPGVSLAQARAAVLTHTSRLALEYPETMTGQRGLVYPEPRARMESSAIAFMPMIAGVFMTLVGLVLLIACANVANLLLSRAAGRQKEMAIRAALGAGRIRIIRQLLTESLILALLGGAFGLVIANWAADYLSSFRVATDLPISFDFSFDYRIFGFAFAIAAAAGILAGLFPALQSSRTDLAVTLKEGGRRGTGGGRHWIRGTLVVAQVAVSLILLVTAGLFVRTAFNATKQDMGFVQENRLLVAMDTEMRQYDDDRGKRFYRELLDNVRSLPGVRSASTARFLPVGFNNGGRDITMEGEVPDPNRKRRFSFYNIVGVDYFKTMGMPIHQGRTFTRNDTVDEEENGRLVVIINDTAAEEYWPGENPLGRMVSISGSDGPFREIVGITRTVNFTLPSESPHPGIYLPYEQMYRSDLVLHVHTEGNPTQMISAVRAEINRLDPEMPIWDVRSMKDHIQKGKMVLFNLATKVVGSFGVIGIILAAIGLYGVMSYTVAQRTHEIGVRMALGASAPKILGLVLRQGALLTAIGLALGMVGASFLTPSFASMLVGVGPRDLLTFTVVSFALLVVALLACTVPAHRASRVDPMVALRYE